MAKTLYVADACALLAYLYAEDGADVVGKLLNDKQNEIIVHAINLCEVYYDVLRANGTQIATTSINELLADGILVREDLDRAFWTDVGQLKVNPGGISLADCVVIALARRNNCDLLTADHTEMDRFAGSAIVRIQFIR